MAETEAVVVGVRVRPFNQKEINQKETCVVTMDGLMTSIDPECLPVAGAQQTSFSFDKSFWSHDGCEDDGTGYMRAKPGSQYADQRYVFDNFGQRVLDNAWAGYHCCLFAYGQTGAGKSYSMVGTPTNKGIVPTSCEDIFRRIGENKDASKSFEVELTMLEIYNEALQDLFVPVDKRPKGGLQIRECKSLGVFVTGIVKNAVASYAGIERAIEHGTTNRTIASTAMNAVSSRAHTVITIEFKQKDVHEGKENVRVSNINLVDLAGSEKSDKTGATGERLKEGSAINKSLSALGNVIEALAERSSNPGKCKKVIPYRDSKLTRLLQNALGGSSKTIMVCALSPARSNAEETLSTLRYADRAKKIKNSVTVNEDPKEKLMREMREENAKLKALVEGFQTASEPNAGLDYRQEMRRSGEIEKQRDQIEVLQRMLAEMEEEQTEKLQETRQREEDFFRERVQRSGDPVILNLNADSQLSGKLHYSFKQGSRRRIVSHDLRKKRASTVSSDLGDLDQGDLDGEAEKYDLNEEDEDICIESPKGASSFDLEEDMQDMTSEAPFVNLMDAGVQGTFCWIRNLDGACVVHCLPGCLARTTWINGISVEDLESKPMMRTDSNWALADESTDERRLDGETKGIVLMHGDRIMFGKTSMLYLDPHIFDPSVVISIGMYTYVKAAAEMPPEWHDLFANPQVVQLQEKMHEKEEEVASLRKAMENSRQEADDAVAEATAAAARSQRPPLPCPLRQSVRATRADLTAALARAGQALQLGTAMDVDLAVFKDRLEMLEDSAAIVDKLQVLTANNARSSLVELQRSLRSGGVPALKTAQASLQLGAPQGAKPAAPAAAPAVIFH